MSTTTASATAPPSSGSSTSTGSPPTPAPASPTTPTAQKTPTTSSARSPRSSPSPSKPTGSSPACPPWDCPKIPSGERPTPDHRHRSSIAPGGATLRFSTSTRAITSLRASFIRGHDFKNNTQELIKRRVGELWAERSGRRALFHCAVKRDAYGRGIRDQLQAAVRTP